MELRIIGVSGLPEVRPGDDLAGLVLEACRRQDTPPCDGDVLVVTQKIVSKAEGRLVRLAEIEPSPFARAIGEQYDKDPRLVEIVLRESRRIVRMDNAVIITENRLGHVCANAGVDASNLAGEGYVALLPADPDASCARLGEGVRRRAGAEVAVVMSDTFGRPWREGCTNVAIGVAGMDPLIDYRGQRDPAGMVLKVTVMAIADELASAAELVMGKMDRVPVALVRGYPYPKGKGGSAALLREPSRDLFR